MILALHQQSSLRGDPSESFEMIMGQLDTQHRRVPTRRIGAHRHREQAKARFIYEDDGAFFLFGLFLSAGHRSSFHLWMAASSRWVARWTGLPSTVLDGTQDAATMGWVVADAEDPLDHLRDPLRRPDLPAIAKRLRSSCQHLWQLGQLLCAQLRLRARGRVTTQRLHSLGSGSFEPLADCSLANS